MFAMSIGESLEQHICNEAFLKTTGPYVSFGFIGISDGNEDMGKAIPNWFCMSIFCFISSLPQWRNWEASCVSLQLLNDVHANVLNIS